jgi:hypothetical protein
MREKDINRFSFSRFKTFHTCPRKHHYQYVEQIETPESPIVLPGKLFHEAIEKILTKQDVEPVFKEFRNLCYTGKLELDADLLESVVSTYMTYYQDEFAKETPLLVEGEITENIDETKSIIVLADEVYKRDNYIYLRDRKTTLNKLKYTIDVVTNNQQLLFYVPYVEEKLGITIDVIEIDEIVMRKLAKVGINANGKPTIDKKRLEFVTYEDYYEVLSMLGLEKNPEYKHILEYLDIRGHPLFRRTRHLLIDRNPIYKNLEDFNNTFDAMVENKFNYRVRSPLCGFCQYRKICDLDLSNIYPEDRRIVIADITGKSFTTNDEEVTEELFERGELTDDIK